MILVHGIHLAYQIPLFTDIWIHLEPLELCPCIHRPVRNRGADSALLMVHSAMYRTKLYYTKLYQAKVLKWFLRNGGDRILISWQYDEMRTFATGLELPNERVADSPSDDSVSLTGDSRQHVHWLLTTLTVVGSFVPRLRRKMNT